MKRAVDSVTKGRLSHRQRRFIAEYQIDGNATQAAIRAGYSSRTARQIAAENLSKPSIAAAIQEHRAKLLAKVELDAERVMREIARIAYFDPRRLFHPDGEPIPINELDDDVVAAIAGLDIETRTEGRGETKTYYTVKKYKLANKVAALEQAARILGLFDADNKQRKGEAIELLREFFSGLNARIPVVRLPPTELNRPGFPGGPLN